MSGIFVVWMCQACNLRCWQRWNRQRRWTQILFYRFVFTPTRMVWCSCPPYRWSVHQTRVSLVGCIRTQSRWDSQGKLHGGSLVLLL